MALGGGEPCWSAERLLTNPPHSLPPVCRVGKVLRPNRGVFCDVSWPSSLAFVWGGVRALLGFKDQSTEVDS